MNENVSRAKLGLLFSFIIPIAGIIISGDALKRISKTDKSEGKGLAIAGIIIGTVILIGCLSITIGAAIISHAVYNNSI